MTICVSVSLHLMCGCENGHFLGFYFVSSRFSHKWKYRWRLHCVHCVAFTKATRKFLILHLTGWNPLDYYCCYGLACVRSKLLEAGTNQGHTQIHLKNQQWYHTIPHTMRIFQQILRQRFWRRSSEWREWKEWNKSNVTHNNFVYAVAITKPFSELFRYFAYRILTIFITPIPFMVFVRKTTNTQCRQQDKLITFNS